LIAPVDGTRSNSVAGGSGVSKGLAVVNEFHDESPWGKTES
jgi:hypothetical protein